MTEVRKYFDLVIGDVISFDVDCDECEYPLTFTVEECVEEYCAMHNMDLVRIIRNDDDDEWLRSGEFWYEQKTWADAFGNIASVQQAITRMGSSMSEIASTMQEEFQSWVGDDE